MLRNRGDYWSHLTFFLWIFTKPGAAEMLPSHRCHQPVAATAKEKISLEVKMQGAKGKIEIAGCLALAVLVYGLFLLSVTEPYRPDVLAWFRGHVTPIGVAKEQRFAQR